MMEQRGCYFQYTIKFKYQTKTMNPTTQTPIIEYILAPHPHPGNQLLETIKQHPQYHQICNNILYALSQSDEGLPTANVDYISMKLCEVSLSNHRIDKLEEMEMKLDCLIQELQDRKQWVSKKADTLHKNKQEAKQDCEILAHQNTKLQAEIEEKENSDNGNSTASRNKLVGVDQRRELEELLKKYRCGTSGFPKNKNQAVRLLNSLEVRLQSLQVQKLGLS